MKWIKKNFFEKKIKNETFKMEEEEEDKERNLHRNLKKKQVK